MPNRPVIEGSQVSEDDALARNSISFANNARQILGADEFRHLGLFFLELLSECHELDKSGSGYMLVLLTRRCHVLFQMYLEYFFALRALLDGSPEKYKSVADTAFSGLEEIPAEALRQIDRKSVTDYNLLSLCPSLADYYKLHACFPKIIIADELLIHGRSFNRFVMDLEERIEGEFAERGQADTVLSVLKESVELRVYAKSEDSMLLLDRYAKKLQVGKECNRRLWRDISARYARLISVASINNISYSWGLRIPLFEGDKDESPAFRDTYPSFERYMTGLQEIPEDNFIYLYPNSREIKAICTIRLKRALLPMPAHSGYLKGSWVLAPYIAFDHLSMDRVLELHQVILEEAPEVFGNLFRENPGDAFDPARHGEGRRAFYYRWFCETNELVMEYLLFRRFVEEVYAGEDAEAFAQYVDFNMIARNYRVIESDKSGLELEAAETVLKSIWSWRPKSGTLERYLSILLKDTQPIWEAASAGNIVSEAVGVRKITPGATISCAVQDTIAELGYRAERNAYERTVSSVPFSENALARWGENCSIGGLLTRCDTVLFECPYTGQTASIFEVVSLLTQAMDLGLLGMSPFSMVPSIQASRTEQIYTMPKAGEQALFILPIRYRLFIPVLLLIQKRRNDPQEIDAEIGRLADVYCNVHREERADFLSKRLIQFLSELRRTGQTLAEWDISLYDFSGIDYFSMDDKPVRAIDRLLDDLNQKIETLELYKNM